MKNLGNIDWSSTYRDLDARSFSIIKSIINPSECKSLIATYNRETLFRKTINMARYRFGSGEYRYFRYPLPPIVQALRKNLYPHLAPMANRWMEALNTGSTYPDQHEGLIRLCHQKNQKRPTPLILKYVRGDYNTLHQDLYGEVYFPFQAILFLSKKNEDYFGGELVLTEQVPRAQSKATVITPDQGDLVILTTRFRPQKGARGFYRTVVRHGVSEVRQGLRHTLGIVFHDAL